MRWFDAPPCTQLDVKETSPGRLFCTGPSAGTRVAGGATAAFGSVFAGVGLRFLRLPIPAPFKLIPLAFAAIGGGVAALGATAAFSSCSLEVTRAALTLKWKVPGLGEHSLVLAAADVEGFEVTTHARASSSDFGDRHEVVEYRLVAVTKNGRALPFESFGTRTQAELRRRTVTLLLLAR